MKAGKVWGWTTPLLRTGAVEVHAIHVLPRSYCSIHRHAHRWNAFYVTRGRLMVDVEQADYALTDRTVLGPGELATVAPGLWHRFSTEDEGAEALEIYYPETLDATDIERRDVGGTRGPRVTQI